jgi:hypothetical protein
MTNNKQQTAVEWLIEQLRNNENIRWRGTNIIELGEQAKEMEKEQIVKAVNKGWNYHEDGFVSWMGEQYYNETYGGGEQ